MADRADANMEHIDFEVRDIPLETVTSADGTTIAYQKSGTGPPVVIVGGGLNEKAMHAELAEGLSTNFTVYNYDRRGRGGSGDTVADRYSVDREVEDLAAVIAATGGPSHVFANCTGGMIAVPAAARGVPIAKLAMYEPPFGGPKVPEGYLEELTTLLAADNRTEAVAMFLKWDALFTDDEVAFFQTHPIWPAFESMAPTMVYDSILSEDADALPTEQLAAITVPSLVLCGNDSIAWMIETCRALADAMPQGQLVSMASTGHLMDDALGAEILTSFFLE
ncbi:alpha/beta fold hydrolase [Salinispora arenicola]|uniref:alpha/beta fold hydrolase n=1 Tax=Salinispora arenicola TaxID=168697 RepID=UPI0016B7784A|nr:alpha/beta hydrolase [Salinispora arenicola]NIL56397.1 alpha/beta hydrolase [Salinispora arenicola]NIL62767.1 alpha/beta hydrolase [Salinispora arenicola]